MADPRFVVLRHQPGAAGRRELHWDLMLEAGGQLRTWALDREPAADTIIAATRLADHRSDYLDYEGPISGGRGEVRRFDHGTYQLLSETSDQLVVRLEGQQLNAQVTIAQLCGEQCRVEFSAG